MAGLRTGFRNENGNVAMMYALMAPVLLLASGAAIDYGRSASIQSELNAAADAAALAALTPAMMQQSASTAQVAAQNMFIALASGISGIPQPQPAPSVTVGANATTGARNVTVTYSTSADDLVRRRDREKRVAHLREFVGERAGPAEHRFLCPARQFALDGAAGDRGRHHADAEPDRRAG